MKAIISPLETLDDAIGRNVRFVVQATEFVAVKIRSFDEETIRTQNALRKTGREWSRPEGEAVRFILSFLSIAGISEAEYLACVYGGEDAVERYYRSLITQTTKDPS